MQLFIYVMKYRKATNHLLKNISVYFDTPQAGIPEGCFAVDNVYGAAPIPTSILV